MCGRFTLFTDLKVLEERFSFSAGGLELAPSYNVAPTQGVLTVLESDEGRVGGHMRWGLVPSWAKDPAMGSRLINARAETVHEKPSFRQALKSRRCLVLADGFYEWRRSGGAKHPMHIALKSGEPFAFAGLWDSWQGPEGQRIVSCTIITTSPNELMEPIHNRMPVILDRAAESDWLDPGVQDTARLREMLVPYPAGDMEAYRVSPQVNSPANNGPECVARLL